MEKFIAMFIEEKILGLHHLALKDRIDKEEIKRIFEASGLSKEEFELINNMIDDSNDFLDIKSMMQDNGYDSSNADEKAHNFYELIIGLCEEYKIDIELWYEAIEKCELILSYYIYEIYKMIM